MPKVASANRGVENIPSDTSWAVNFGIERQFNRYLHLAAKRVMDVTCSSIGLLVLLPLFVVVSILIKLESPGPVFFTQSRWGLNQRRIRVYKFRSMSVASCDASGVQQTVQNDCRVTRVGRVLRRTNIDELPQLINVLKGDMALVGPRCHPIGMLAAGVPYEDLVPDYHLRHLAKPGITGLAQCRGLRGPTVRSSKARARIANDIYYVRNYSVWLDVKIVFWTIQSEIRGGSGF